jgi:hypothetical protein
LQIIIDWSCRNNFRGNLYLKHEAKTVSGGSKSFTRLKVSPFAFTWQLAIKCKTSDDPEVNVDYKLLKQGYHRTLNRAKRSFNDRRIAVAVNKHREIWNIINSNTNSPKIQLHCLLNDAGYPTADFPQLAEVFVQQFSSPPSLLISSSLDLLLSIPSNPSSLYLTPCTATELGIIIASSCP